MCFETMQNDESDLKESIMTNDFENNASNTNVSHGGEKPLGAAELTLLHKFCSHHRGATLESDTCGCFYCGSIFPASEVEEWTIEPGFGAVTALCPRCEIDAVLPSSVVKETGFELDPALLSQMKDYWFDLAQKG